MSQPATLFDFQGFVEFVANLIDEGRIRSARRHAAAMLDGADPRTLTAIEQCARTVENYPSRCVQILRARWKAADEHAKPVISAFGIALNQQQQLRPARPSQSAPRWTRDNAPRNEHRYVRPGARREMTAERRAATDRQEFASAVMADYEHRAGVDDTPQRAQTTYASGFDYDRAAIPDLRGTLCVNCWLERAVTDHHISRSDDGLCGDCREKGRPGIPALPEGHTHADIVEARCAHIAARHPKVARRVLAQWWKKATPSDRLAIAGWVERNPFTTTTDAPKPDPETSAPQTAARDTRPHCQTCGQERKPHDLRHRTTDDGLCTDCRWVDEQAAAA